MKTLKNQRWFSYDSQMAKKAKKAGASAWVVRWVWFGNHRSPESQILHFLKPWWPTRRVSQYLQALYLNTMVDPTSRPYYLKPGRIDPVWKRMIFEQWPHVAFGHNPELLAVFVEDLIVTRIDDTKVEVSFTQLARRTWQEARDQDERRGFPMKFLIEENPDVPGSRVITDVTTCFAT